MTLCPRCEDNELTKFPALSRADNRTHVCPECGTDEALIQCRGGTLAGPEYWPQPQVFEFEAHIMHNHNHWKNNA